MARTLAPAHPAPHHHPAPHKAPPHHAPAPKKRPAHHGGLIAGIVAGTLAGLGALWLAFAPGTDRLDPTETLLEQMHAAAAGAVPATHAFGGALTVTYGNGPANITAEALPAKACVQVGWRLSKEGTIIVNGVLPQRLSAAKLSELCSTEGGATLTWVPGEG